ncbi:sulfotransferase domain-containing protein [Romeria aff. gracilis LEGE 07310]|uniref:Sulfotransferase domain-containing protein n=1 Tax=Vasconcelosia minhoensis LEGE 07310 TaxID=915328 RepID=A0A8J7AJC6_9CYAN|nr:sulfotransferase domain-containing protein [Romeria gracilis]MBE9080141.1 sulfotransferase domain-containing protein [Romeria aff. gracilis LEGE 07310]
MSYQAHNVARLHARDLIFFIRYLKEVVVNLDRSKSFLICNSYPKSGTHLLYQILYTIPGFLKWDDIVSVQALCGIMNTASHIKWKLGSAPTNSIIRSHLTYCDEVLDVFKEHDCKTFFIYRDLRDVALSHARWVCNEERIFLHELYLKHSSFDKKLMNSIKGVPLGTPFGSNASQPNIGEDFSRWLGWIDDPNTIAIKFEDLVGERGGGCEETRLHLIEKILAHLETNLSTQEIKAKFSSSGMNPRESHTFRKGAKGSKGGWKEAFTEAHKDAFKEVAGELLIQLGYENNSNW